MKLIKPSQISGEIMTLIEEADGKLIVVSPYCKFSDWKKMLNTIDYLKRKNTPVEFYVREGENNTIKEVEKLGYSPILVPNLHTKLYINESFAIVSSMNLLTYSDANSLDIAYKTETKEEYNELIEYYERYLNIYNVTESHYSNVSEIISSDYANLNYVNEISNGEWAEYLSEMLESELDLNFRLSFDDSLLVIQCNNKYEAFIYNKGKDNHLAIMGILSQKESDVLKNKISSFKEKSGLDISIEKSGYNTVWHHSNLNLKSSNLSYLYKSDYNAVIQIIFDFIFTVQDFKEYIRYN